MTPNEIGWLALVCVAAFLVWIVYIVVNDIKRIRRGDPIKIWYLPNKIYPDDQWRLWAIVQMLGPPLSILLVLTLLVIGAVIVSIFGLQP